MINERWFPVDGHIGYEVSDQGRMRSIRRVIVSNNGVSRTFRGRTMKQMIDRYGYPVVGLSSECRVRTRAVHRIVATAFHPNPAGCPEVNHLNGIKTDNTASNLQWCTSSENKRHAFATGLWIPPKGEKNGQAKLTEEDVARIRSRLASGEKHRIIAADFGVCRQMIGMIKTGRNWQDKKNRAVRGGSQ